MKKYFFLVAVIVICSRLSAQTKVYPVLTEAKPETAGMSPERLKRIDNLIQEYVNNGTIPGADAIIVHDGKVVYHKGIGFDDADKQHAMKKDEIFRIASQTKAITSTAVMMLYEEGKLLLDDPISKYIPEFKNPTVLDHFNAADTTYTTVPAKREVTIRDLLTHTSGIDYAVIGGDEMKAIYAKEGIPSGIATLDKTLGPEMKKLGKLPLAHQPGEKFTYGLNTDVLGYLVEILSGLSLSDFFQKRIFEPLGMKDSYFYIPADKHNRLASLSTFDESHHLIKYPDVANGLHADYPNRAGKYYSGGAGLTSTTYDYAIFLQMMLNGGIYNGKRILSPNSVRMMTMNQIGDLSVGSDKFGLGFEVVTEKGSSKYPNNIGTFSWGGYFGTTYWADPKEKIVALIMTQIAPSANSPRSDLSDKFKVAVYQALNN
ncbi:MAG: beta-lactamase family protein [Bacteroidetes bacterium]|nr:beta-lactamase family protein [Bacteroidota bacterium]